MWSEGRQVCGGRVGEYGGGRWVWREGERVGGCGGRERG